MALFIPIRTDLEIEALKKLKKGDIVKFMRTSEVVKLEIVAHWPMHNTIRCRVYQGSFLALFNFYGDDVIYSYNHEGWNLWLNEESLNYGNSN